MSRRPAFTLIELMITSLILVTLVTLTLSIFTNISRLQLERTSTQSLSSQIRQISSQLDDAVRSAVAVSAFPSASFLGWPSDSLAVQRQIATEQGTLNVNNTEWQLYCTVPTTVVDRIVRRLVRVRVTYDQASPAPTFNPSATGDCSTNATNFFVGGTSLVQRPTEYLASQTVDMSDLRFTQIRPVVTNTQIAQGTWDAVRIECNIQDLENGGSNILSFRGTYSLLNAYDHIIP